MKDNATILIVDNDPVILRFVSANLKSRGFAAVTADDGEAALRTLEQTLPDLVMMDVMLPDISGVELCQRIREWSRVPIIMLTAKNELDATQDLQNLGADDYITKPFGIEVLLARVRAVLRRSSAAEAAEAVAFVNDDLEINFADRRVAVGGQQIDLSPKEYELLRELAQNAGKVLTHQMLLSRVWGADYGKETEYLRVYIGRLRSKIEADSKHPKHIHTKSGAGYWLQRHKKK